MGYKVIKDNGKSFEVEHPDGSRFKVAKSHLDKKLLEKITGMIPQNLADGGMVKGFEDDSIPAKEEIPIQTQVEPKIESPAAQDGLLIEPVVKEKDLGASREPAAVAQPVQPVKQEESAPVIPKRIFGPKVEESKPKDKGILGEYESAFKGLEEAKKQEAAAEKQSYAQQSKIYEDNQKKLQSVLDNYKAQYAVIDATDKQLTNDARNAKLDPDRYWSSKSTGQKIAASIALALGGIGAGMARTENYAAKIIGDAINRDVEAQKIDINKKENLVAQNLRKYGELNAATQASILQLTSIAQGQIADVAAKTKEKTVQAKALEEIKQLELQKIPLKQKLAESLATQTAMSQISQGSGSAQINQLPENVRERAVPINGRVALALDKESAKEARKIVGNHTAFMDNLDQLIALRNKYGSETLPTAAKAEMETLASNLQLAVKEAKALGTLDKGAEKFMEKLVANPTSYAAPGVIETQYKALKSAQNRETTSKLKSLGVNPAGIQAKEEMKSIEGKRV